MPVMKPRLLALLLSCVLAGGCVWVGFPPPGPPPEAVLAGTWLVTPERSTQITELLWTFDNNGNLVEVKYTVPTLLLGGDATITEQVVSQDTTVDGSNVTVQVGTDRSNSTFQGTMNEAQNQIEGTLSLNLIIGFTTIEVDQGAATLAKQ